MATIAFGPAIITEKTLSLSCSLTWLKSMDFLVMFKVIMAWNICESPSTWRHREAWVKGPTFLEGLSSKIERLWCDLSSGFGDKWKQFFQDLEQHDGLTHTLETLLRISHRQVYSSFFQIENSADASPLLFLGPTMGNTSGVLPRQLELLHGHHDCLARGAMDRFGTSDLQKLSEELECLLPCPRPPISFPLPSPLMSGAVLAGQSRTQTSMLTGMIAPPVPLALTGSQVSDQIEQLNMIQEIQEWQQMIRDFWQPILPDGLKV
ncbi:hypothetical protein F4604DRAFT_1679618 [Suillus subluteus]|nr:hypothetical protein F4604DRAFT_1679618 [Suillus subluteus]